MKRHPTFRIEDHMSVITFRVKGGDKRFSVTLVDAFVHEGSVRAFLMIRGTDEAHEYVWQGGQEYTRCRQGPLRYIIEGVNAEKILSDYMKAERVAKLLNRMTTKTIRLKVTPVNAPSRTQAIMVLEHVGIEIGTGRLRLLLQRDEPNGRHHDFIQERSDRKNLFVPFVETGTPHQDQVRFFIGGLIIRAILR